MKTSSYTERITIESLVDEPEQNTVGEVDLSEDRNWEEHFECFAEVIPRGTKEFTRAGVVDADVQHIIRVHRSSETEAITSDMRIQWNGVVLTILAAFPCGQERKEIEIRTRY